MVLKLKIFLYKESMGIGDWGLGGGRWGVGGVCNGWCGRGDFGATVKNFYRSE